MNIQKLGVIRLKFVILALVLLPLHSFVFSRAKIHSVQAVQAADVRHTSAEHKNITDVRVLVNFPDLMRIGTLRNMRAHLEALGDIEAALASGLFDKAANIAEYRLGMSSLQNHGAHHVATHMPKGMQELGTVMHRNASQFARIAENAGITKDYRTALDALARVTKSCVACHAAYRLH